MTRDQAVAMVQTGGFYGFKGVAIRVEADMRAGLPSLQIVGMGSKAIDEARPRVRSAILNSGLQFPARKLVINLAPAELPKDGTHFDMPIAMSILCASGQVHKKQLHGIAFAGELSLNGDVLPVRGAILLAEAAKAAGATTLYIPTENYSQATLVEGIAVIPVQTLKEVFQRIRGDFHAEEYTPVAPTPPTKVSPHPSIADIVGQETAKRALLLAAAGNHNILLYGPPGTGKTLLAKSALHLLPPLSKEESIEVTKLHSIAGLTHTPVTTPPLRNPHHSVTPTALLGGGRHPKPGDVSLAHRGILLLDELPEYPRATLEALRQPLEDASLTVSRLHTSVTYPADVLLIATMNPCPCGFFDDNYKECRCSPVQRARYQQRLSGPLLERIDLCVTVPRNKDEYFFDSKSLTKKQHTPEVNIIKRVRSIQKQRYKRSGQYNGNASMNTVQSVFKIHPKAHELARDAQQTLHLSGRSILKTFRIARTIADVEGSVIVQRHHVAEALQFRNHSIP